MSATKIFQSNLKYLRKLSGINQVQLALQLNKAQSSISSWESDGIEPSYEDLQKITRIFDISVDDFIKRDLAKGKGMDIPETLKKGKGIGKPIGKLTGDYAQNDTLSVVSESEPATGESFKDKYLALLEEMHRLMPLNYGVLQQNLLAVNARLMAVQEYTLNALQGLDNKGSYEEKSAVVHRMAIENLKGQKGIVVDE